ncbi:hypothetical protein IL306_011506 [Fusarium sp. DS 682]|nr:hypothetical protein IL306_011506 [Fusarium sp. DS 682]
MRDFTPTPSPGHHSDSSSAGSPSNEVKAEDGLLVVKKHIKDKILDLARRTYPAVLPPPSDPLLICYIYSCGAYAKSRDHGADIYTPMELGPSEVDCLSEHLRSFESSHPRSYKRRQLILYGDLHYFLTTVFYRWDTTKQIKAKPVLREQVLEEYAVKLGLLSHDIGSIIDEDGLPDEDGRHKWDFAYLAIEQRNEGKQWRFAWKDKNGNDVDDKDVELSSFLQNDIQAARKACFENFDKKQNQRIMAHN